MENHNSDLPDSKNGSGVPLEKIVAPVFAHFNLKMGSGEIMEKASEYLESLISSEDLERMRFTLWGDPILSLRHLRFAVVFGGIDNISDYFFCSPKIGGGRTEKAEFSSRYRRWIAAQGTFLLEIAKHTKEEDPTLQHFLNYEDFIQELSLTQTGRQIIASLYELRGLDFFLFHYMGRETSALEDSALFNNARKIPHALRAMGRVEEAIKVEKDIDTRERKIVKIKKEFKSITETPDKPAFVIKQLRLRGERFWNEYVQPEVWSRLDERSRYELVDAFVTEIFLERGILRGWNQVILMLCKVIEREMAKSLFNPFVDSIRASYFSDPENFSRRQFKRIQSRKVTYDTIKNCATEPVQPPTLGQLIFMAKFWNDPLMDDCTSLFSSIRKELERFNLDATKVIEKLAFYLEEPYSVDGESATVLTLRNASAHPCKEGAFTWSKYVEWLKNILGKHPKSILRSLIIDLRWIPN